MKYNCRKWHLNQPASLTGMQAVLRSEPCQSGFVDAPNDRWPSQSLENICASRWRMDPSSVHQNSNLCITGLQLRVIGSTAAKCDTLSPFCQLWSVLHIVSSCVRLILPLSYLVYVLSCLCLILPWNNCCGWLGVKYLLLIYSILSPSHLISMLLYLISILSDSEYLISVCECMCMPVCVRLCYVLNSDNMYM